MASNASAVPKLAIVAVCAGTSPVRTFTTRPEGPRIVVVLPGGKLFEQQKVILNEETVVGVFVPGITNVPVSVRRKSSVTALSAPRQGCEEPHPTLSCKFGVEKRIPSDRHSWPVTSLPALRLSKILTPPGVPLLKSRVTVPMLAPAVIELPLARSREAPRFSAAPDSMLSRDPPRARLPPLVLTSGLAVAATTCAPFASRTRLLLAMTSLPVNDRSVFDVVIVPPETCSRLAVVATMLSAVLISGPASDIVAPGPTDTKSPTALNSEGSRSMTGLVPVLVKPPATFSTLLPAKTTLLFPFRRDPASVTLAPGSTPMRLSTPSCCTVVNPKLCAAARISAVDLS